MQNHTQSRSNHQTAGGKGENHKPCSGGQVHRRCSAENFSADTVNNGCEVSVLISVVHNPDRCIDKLEHFGDEEGLVEGDVFDAFYHLCPNHFVHCITSSCTGINS